MHSTVIRLYFIFQILFPFCCCSVTQSCWLSATAWTAACSNSCPLCQWCLPTISSFVIPFSSCLQSFPASESFLMSPLFASGGQSFRASASASALPVNIQVWFPLGWTGWILLQSKGLSRVFSSTAVQKHQLFSTQPFIVQLSHPHVTTGKTIALTLWTFVDKVISLLFNMLSRFPLLIITKCWTQFPVLYSSSLFILYVCTC